MIHYDPICFCLNVFFWSWVTDVLHENKPWYAKGPRCALTNSTSQTVLREISRISGNSHVTITQRCAWSTPAQRIDWIDAYRKLIAAVKMIRSLGDVRQLGHSTLVHLRNPPPQWKFCVRICEPPLWWHSFDILWFPTIWWTSMKRTLCLWHPMASHSLKIWASKLVHPWQAMSQCLSKFYAGRHLTR